MLWCCWRPYNGTVVGKTDKERLMKFNEIIEEWTTSRTFAYLGAAAACAAAASAYKRAQAKGRSRLYVLLAMAWAALTV